jgi:hypothetical protein
MESKWNKIKRNDMKWHDMKRNETKWNEMKRNETKWKDLKCYVVKWNSVKWKSAMNLSRKSLTAQWRHHLHRAEWNGAWYLLWTTLSLLFFSLFLLLSYFDKLSYKLSCLRSLLSVQYSKYVSYLIYILAAVSSIVSFIYFKTFLRLTHLLYVILCGVYYCPITRSPP